MEVAAYRNIIIINTLAEILHFRLQDILVELLTVLNGEQYRVELSDGTKVVWS
jgi:hypothetical protein